MARAIIASFAFTVILLTISCAKPESNTPPTAMGGQSVDVVGDEKAENERESRQRSAGIVNSGSESGKQSRTGGAPERLSGSDIDGVPAATTAEKTEAAAETAAETAAANDDPKKSESAPQALEMIANGALGMNAPANWEKVAAASSMIEIEYSVPNEGDLASGRVTGMSAGGSVEMNISRWYDQFSQPDGSPSKDHAKVEEMQVGDLKIHTMDITGTFLEGMGPLAPKTQRDDYRMLAAIIELDGDFKYFLKFYGPAALVEKNAEPFSAMLNSLKPVD